MTSISNGLQKARPFLIPSSPKVSEAWSIIFGASKPGIERIATEIGAHLNYVKQNLFRMLAIIISEERDPHFPDIPTLKDLKYKDMPPSRFVPIAPKGLPEPVFKKVEEGFRKAAYPPKFRKVMEDLNPPFVFRDRKQLEGEYPSPIKFPPAS